MNTVIFKLHSFLMFPLERPDFNDAIIMRRGASVEHVVRANTRTVNIKINLSWTLIPRVSMLVWGVSMNYHKYACFASSPQCHRIHRTLASQFKYALVWVSTFSDAMICRNISPHLFWIWTVLSVGFQGTSTKYSPQRVGLTHIMEHEDVIQIVKK